MELTELEDLQDELMAAYLEVSQLLIDLNEQAWWVREPDFEGVPLGLQWAAAAHARRHLPGASITGRSTP